MRVVPPVIAALYLGAAAGIDRVLPSDPLVPVGTGSRIVGISCFVLGIVLAIWAAVQFNRADTTKDPYGTPTALVTSGPFNWTRNPMYMGMTMVLLGIGLHFATAVFVAVPVAFLLTVNRWFVPREEKALHELFGAQFEEYKARVRRWI